MKIDSLFKKDKAVVSYEVFPPKKDSPIESVFGTLEALCNQKPDYISVTYGAGGSESKRTIEIAKVIKQYGIEPMTHLTALYNDEEDVLNFIKGLKEAEIENILALRGDKVPGVEGKGVFNYASDLTRFIKANSDINVVGACYPECHYECESLDKDIENLKYKIDAGVTHLNTQLFFDNGDFFTYLEKLRKAGINIPIEAGIMPIVKSTQIERTLKLTGAKVPPQLAKLFAKYADNPVSLTDAGIAYATNQIAELLAGGIDGVHLYVMNNEKVAKRLRDNIESLR